MRRVLQTAHAGVSTVSPERIAWMRDPSLIRKVTLIPVGSNVPRLRRPERARAVGGCKRVIVFGIGAGPTVRAEITARQVADISHAVRSAAEELHRVRLEVFGRGSEHAAARLTRALQGTAVDISITGVLPAEQISRRLNEADALLFVQGHVSTRRTTCVAGIASGVPVIGYTGEETGFPLTTAGVLLVPEGDREGLGRALTRVLRDDELWHELQRKNMVAYEQHFSWEAIAQRYVGLLKCESAMRTVDQQERPCE
jgi:glycosyltransferase involved in cell wall biosynthesis